MQTNKPSRSIPIRLSHSSLSTLQTCERKFQLEKLLAGTQREESEHFAFGHAIGVGVATYFETQDADVAIYKAWLAYWPEIETVKKNWVKAHAGLLNAFGHIDNLLQDYEIVFYEGKPAAELSFRLEINDDFYFVGHIDLVLRHKWTGRYCVFEVKHTGLQLQDLTPLYANSGQALGYSIALDRIVGSEQSSYDVVYFVVALGREASYDSKIHVLPFQKSLVDRLNWFITLAMDVQKIEQMQEIGVFPKRGDACLKYNRPCQHFSTCGLSAFEQPAEEVPDTIHYHFSYKLDDLVQDHVQRVEAQKMLKQTLLGA